MKKVFKGWIKKTAPAKEILKWDRNEEGRFLATGSTDVFEFKGERDQWYGSDWLPKPVKITVELGD